MLEVSDYPVKVNVKPPEGTELKEAMTALNRICSQGDGYVLTVRSRRVFRAVGSREMRRSAAWETAAVHRLGNLALIFPVPEPVVLQTGAVHAPVNLLLPTELGFEVAEAWRELTGSAAHEEGGVDGRTEQAS